MKDPFSPFRDVCPSTRLRCPHPARCWREHCGGSRDLHPVAEGDLTREELYHLRLVEQRAALERGRP